MKQYAAFFDLDNTILSESTGRLFVPYALKHRLWGKRDLIFGLYVNLMRRAGIYSIPQVIQKWTQRIRGRSVEEMAASSRDFFRRIVLHYIRPEIIGEIEYHRESGGSVLILSASPSFICRPIQEHLKMDGSLCSVLEINNGTFTGKLTEKYCYGSEKLNRATAHCLEKGLLLSDAYYYADSLADLPVLERVGTPVCVYPARRLRKIAVSRGWRIIE